jgi:hypothetical protein
MGSAVITEGDLMSDPPHDFDLAGLVRHAEPCLSGQAGEISLGQLEDLEALLDRNSEGEVPHRRTADEEVVGRHAVVGEPAEQICDDLGGVVHTTDDR